jgi:hypothetical protein
MAGVISAGSRGHPGTFRGLTSLFEYTNGDGARRRTNCGQAAAATLLTHLGVFPPDPDRAGAVMGVLERYHPPDQLGGLLGTGRRRVARMCRAYGVRLVEIRGEHRLRDCLAAGRPALVLLHTSAGKLLGRYKLPGGHWAVAYGFDAASVYLSSRGPMSWADFRRAWLGPVPSLARMRGRGLVPRIAPWPTSAEFSLSAAGMHPPHGTAPMNSGSVW